MDKRMDKEALKNKFNMKKILIVILIVIAFILVYFGYYIVSVHSINKNSDEMEKITKKLDSNYVFVDINPALTLSVQNDKVIKYSCRNKDCSIIKGKFSKIVGLNISDAVELIYNVSKEEGFDTSGGVSIKTSEVLGQSVSNIKYVKIEIINKEDEKKLLEENEDNISDEKLEENDQLKELKKDKDYGEIYTCKENNGDIECYLNKDLEIHFNNIVLQKRIASVLNRFGIKTESAWEMGIVEEPLFKIYIDGVKFVNAFGDTVGSMEYLGTYACNDARFKLSDLNLVHPVDIKEHFFNREHDVVNEVRTDEIQVDYSGRKYDVYGKKHVKYLTYYCDVKTQQQDYSEREAYVIYKVDGSDSKEVSKEEYEDFNAELGVYMRNVEECEFGVENVGGEMFRVLKIPRNGKYCKYEGNIEYYDPNKLFDY